MDTLSASQKEFIKYGVGLAIGIGTGAIVWAWNGVNNYKEGRYLRKLVQERQSTREQKLTSLQAKHKMTPEFEHIISLTMDELLDQLSSRRLTATQVLEAFIAKALEANSEFNCVTEFNPKALEMAAELDQLHEPKGPLHGIPFCVKDDTAVIGMDSTVGFAKNLNKPWHQSATIVQVLVDLGGIPFCRTNLPQSCISFGSHNPIFGKTLNPHNKKLSPGGSSSGTGALIGANGAHFGIGTDTGGSARVPAHFCGINSLKSSKNRVSRKGCLLCIEPAVGLVSTPCIMAKRASDVSFIFRAMTENNQHNQYDGKAMPLRWNQQLFESSHKLRVGFYTSLTVFPSLGDTKDTVLHAKSALEALGHTLVPFEISESEHYKNVILQLSLADLGTHLAEKLKNDQVSPIIKELADFGRVAPWKRWICSILPSWLNSCDPKLMKCGLSVASSAKLWDCMAERHFIIEKLLERMNELKLDLILCPAWPFPALPVDTINNDAMIPGMYTFIWNLVDFPAGIVQVGKESGEHFDDPYDENGDRLRKTARKQIRESVGMPIGVQIVGRPFNEELVLRAMTELEKQIRQ